MILTDNETFMVPEIKPSLAQRIKDTVLQIDSNPAHIGQVLHYRGCSRNKPLEVMYDDEEPMPFLHRL